jgi:hypothetical protein
MHRHEGGRHTNAEAESSLPIIFSSDADKTPTGYGTVVTCISLSRISIITCLHLIRLSPSQCFKELRRKSISQLTCVRRQIHTRLLQFFNH